MEKRRDGNLKLKGYVRKDRNQSYLSARFAKVMARDTLLIRLFVHLITQFLLSTSFQPVYENQVMLSTFGKFTPFSPLEFSEKAELPFPICLKQALQTWLIHHYPLPPARHPYS